MIYSFVLIVNLKRLIEFQSFDGTDETSKVAQRSHQSELELLAGHEEKDKLQFVEDVHQSGSDDIESVFRAAQTGIGEECAVQDDIGCQDAIGKPPQKQNGSDNGEVGLNCPQISLLVFQNRFLVQIGGASREDDFRFGEEGPEVREKTLFFLQTDPVILRGFAVKHDDHNKG